MGGTARTLWLAPPGQGLHRVDLNPALLRSNTGFSLRDANQASSSYGENFRTPSSQRERHLVVNLLAHVVGDSFLHLHQRGTNKDTDGSEACLGRGKGLSGLAQLHSQQHFSPFSWSWETQAAVRLSPARAPGPGPTPGRRSPAALGRRHPATPAAWRFSPLDSCSDDHVLTTCPQDLGPALLSPQQAWL